MPVRTKLILATIVLAIGLGGAMLFRRGAKSPAVEPASNSTLPLRAGAGLGDFSARFDGPAPAVPTPTDMNARRMPQPVAATGTKPSPPSDESPPELPPRYADLDANSEPSATSPQRQLPVATASSPQPRKHKVVDGDTLVTLAQRYLGRGDRYMDLFDANRSLLTDPDVLPIGLELLVPDRDAAPVTSPAATPPSNAGEAPLVPIPRGTLRRPLP